MTNNHEPDDDAAKRAKRAKSVNQISADLDAAFPGVKFSFLGFFDTKLQLNCIQVDFDASYADADEVEAVVDRHRGSFEGDIGIEYTPSLEEMRGIMRILTPALDKMFEPDDEPFH